MKNDVFVACDRGSEIWTGEWCGMAHPVTILRVCTLKGRRDGWGDNDLRDIGASSFTAWAILHFFFSSAKTPLPWTIYCVCACVCVPVCVYFCVLNLPFAFMSLSTVFLSLALLAFDFQDLSGQWVNLEGSSLRLLPGVTLWGKRGSSWGGGRDIYLWGLCANLCKLITKMYKICNQFLCLLKNQIDRKLNVSALTLTSACFPSLCISTDLWLLLQLCICLLQTSTVLTTGQIAYDSNHSTILGKAVVIAVDQRSGIAIGFEMAKTQKFKSHSLIRGSWLTQTRA